MFTKEIYTYIEYHLSSANSSIYFNNRSAHLKHYDEHIVEIQNKVGLSHYDDSKSIELSPPIENNSQSLTDIFKKEKVIEIFQTTK